MDYGVKLEPEHYLKPSVKLEGGRKRSIGSNGVSKRFRGGRSRGGVSSFSSVRRRRLGRRGRRGGRVPRGVRSARLPLVTKTHASGSVSIGNAGKYSRLVWNSSTPRLFARMFRECRLVSLKVSVRRRVGPGALYQPTDDGGAVSASRPESNAIYWVPWGIDVAPVLPPRQIKSARILSDFWSTRWIKQSVVRRFEYQYFGDGPNVLDTFSLGYDRVPWVNFNSASVMPLHAGYLFVENSSTFGEDILDFKVEAVWQLRHRVNLSAEVDVSSAPSAIDIQALTVVEDAKVVP